MTKIPYEIPAEIRDLTAKSVEEARKAFGSFIEAAHKATAQAEGTANALQSSAKDVSAKALSFTEANLKAAFDHAQKLIQAKDPQEILAHQSEYVKKQLAAMEEHAKELGTAVLKVVTPDKLSRHCGLAVSWSGWQGPAHGKHQLGSPAPSASLASVLLASISSARWACRA